jgi:TldD protein
MFSFSSGGEFSKNDNLKNMTIKPDPLALATNELLVPGNIQLASLGGVFDRLSTRQLDYADLYFQSTVSETWFLEEGIVKSGSYNIDRGVGVRAVSGSKTGFAYSNEINMSALEKAAGMAGSISHEASPRGSIVLQPQSSSGLYLSHNPLSSLTDFEKIELLQLIDRIARQVDPRVIRVTASLSASYTTVLIVTLEGRVVPDIRPLVRCNVNVIVENGKGRTEQGSAGGGGRYDYSLFIKQNKAQAFAQEAVRQALINLEAVAAPAGMLPVVLGPGWPGVLLHEAIGHGLEGDFNRKGTSAFSNRLGEQVASTLCTIVDDGTLLERRGSLSVDDEGTPTRCTTLIEKGILRGYMQDSHNARLMKTDLTGNCRRESYACLPMPRMTNTYMLPGEHNPAEIIASVKRGIYAVNFAGGQVDITSGQFVFSTSEAYLIENGKITTPIKGATLIGNGPDVLTKVSMVGNDLALDSGIGVCGKDGQSVPVGVGQPTLKVDAMTVGGTE